jgi:hypothetical protein
MAAPHMRGWQIQFTRAVTLLGRPGRGLTGEYTMRNEISRRQAIRQLAGLFPVNARPAQAINRRFLLELL